LLQCLEVDVIEVVVSKGLSKVEMFVLHINDKGGEFQRLQSHCQ
jgi:hypothetical protein